MVLCGHVSGLGQRETFLLFLNQVHDFGISAAMPDIVWTSVTTGSNPELGASSVAWIAEIPDMSHPACQALVTRCLGWTWAPWEKSFSSLQVSEKLFSPRFSTGTWHFLSDPLRPHWMHLPTQTSQSNNLSYPCCPKPHVRSHHSAWQQKVGDIQHNIGNILPASHLLVLISSPMTVSLHICPEAKSALFKSGNAGPCGFPNSGQTCFPMNSLALVSLNSVSPPVKRECKSSFTLNFV